MPVWQVLFCDEFVLEFEMLAEAVQDALLAQLQLLEHFGPALGRPQVDTLKGSRYANMKELRFIAAGGVWRVAFAFDPARRAVVLVGGDKSGGSERRFYTGLIKRADSRFSHYLATLQEGKDNA